MLNHDHGSLFKLNQQIQVSGELQKPLSACDACPSVESVH